MKNMSSFLLKFNFFDYNYILMTYCYNESWTNSIATWYIQAFLVQFYSDFAKIIKQKAYRDMFKEH